MKKLFLVLLVLGIFAVSLFPAIAEDSPAEDVSDDSITVVSDENASDDGAAEDIPLKERVKEKVQGRMELREKAVEARMSFVEAKQKYLEIKESYLEDRKGVLELRKEYAPCKDRNSTQCTELKEDMQDSAKSYLSNIADLIISSLEKVKARISESNMSENEKADLIADLDAKIAELEAAKEDVNSSEDSADIKDAAKTIKSGWVDAKHALKKSVGKTISSKMAGIIVQSEKLGEKLDRIVAKLKDKGYNTTLSEELVAEFNMKIDSAKANLDKAVDALKVDDNSSAAKAQDYLKAAHQDLKDARVILRDAVKEIKGVGNGAKAIKDESKDNETEDESDVNETEDEDSDVNETDSDVNETEED